MSDGARDRRQKVAVLGGGVGAMTAAFALTDWPGWDEYYDVTVYQMGWRLGGKGASGRNPNYHQRIEEHGLHVWLGFYENAFRLIQRCYAELERPDACPIRTWTDAFKKLDYVVYEEEIDGTWEQWRVHYPVNDEVPGTGDVLPRPWDFVQLILSWMAQLFLQSPVGRGGSEIGQAVAGHLPQEQAVAQEPVEEGRPPLWERAIRRGARVIRDMGETAEGVLFQTSHQLAQALAADASNYDDADLQRLIRWVDRLETHMWDRVEPRIEADATLRHMWVQIDMWSTILRGMIVDRVVLYGWDSIDDQDLGDWLEKHGASRRLAVTSTWVRAAYDLVFGFSEGKAAAPRLAAGVGVRGLLRLALTYRGAVGWKMQAGMGDIVFSPLYEVLKQRGVKFRFFHRVRNLGLSPDGEAIDRITIGRQAELVAAAADPLAEYEPLVDVGGLPCWPSEPRWEQLVNGQQMRQANADFESHWAFVAETPIDLVRGRDFDQVVLGIPIGALPFICTELIATSERWQRMIAHVKTVRTQAFQLWLTPNLAQLGWRQPPGRTTPILTSNVEPIDTWADMGHLVPHEAWPAQSTPGTIAYFCGPMEDSGPEPPPGTDPTYQARMDRLVEAQARKFLAESARHLWPAACRDDDGCFDWSLLVDPRGRTGEARLSGQFFRANVSPSERYVVSLPGTMRHRLKSDRSGFANLFLAGDWTYTGVNGGCVEAAVMSGLRAARGLCGRPATIIGESDH